MEAFPRRARPVGASASHPLAAGALFEEPVAAAIVFCEPSGQGALYLSTAFHKYVPEKMV
jgi:hypothetical protein